MNSLHSPASADPLTEPQLSWQQRKLDLLSQGVSYALASFVDLHGTSKAKAVPLDHFEAMLAGSELFTGAALDGVPQDVSDDEVAAIPDLATATVLPWSRDVVWLASSLHLQGQAYEACSRNILIRALQEAELMVDQGSMSGSTWAQVFICYCNNNRTNMLRIPSAGGRVECRAADSACNPYLGAGMILAAELEGVREELDPDAPISLMPTCSAPSGGPRGGLKVLPLTLGEAIEASAADPLSLSLFGDAIADAFIDYKRTEWADYHGCVSGWELARYLQFL
ncbi:MAG: hypothetical protein QUV06_04460 [Cyanobium sp. CZS 48M]|nr:hypothetical protein [Cyanobium sp. CZS48M]